MKKVDFKHISDAYFMYWNMYLKYRKYEFSNNEVSVFFILNSVFSSFLVEIGFKTLIAYENKQIKECHNLACLFNQLNIETQNFIIKQMDIEIIKFKEELKKNADHFQCWRYYYELKINSYDFVFFDKLLAIITSWLEVLKNR